MLSDAEKRRQYDLYGPEQANNVRSHNRGQRSGFYEHDPTHGFEAGKCKFGAENTGSPWGVPSACGPGLG